MELRIKTNGLKPWVARIVGNSNNYGYERIWCRRISNTIHGTGIARFDIPGDVNDSYEVCFGDPDCRQFIEIYPPIAAKPNRDAVEGFYYPVEVPGEEIGPNQATHSLTEPLTAPTVNPKHEKYLARLAKHRAAQAAKWEADEFDGDDW